MTGRTKLGFRLLRVIAFLGLQFATLVGLAQPMERYHNDMLDFHHMFANRFKAGQTNDVPRLLIEWFYGATNGGACCHVEQSGKISFTEFAYTNGGNWKGLVKTNSTDMPLLNETVNRLPPAAEGSLPYGRQLAVSGIRSNQWFHRVYDRASMPGEVVRLLDVIGLHLDEPLKAQGKSVHPWRRD